MSKNVKITGKVLVIQLGRVESQLALVQGGTEVLYSAVLATPMGAVEDGMIQNPEAVQRMLKEALREPELKRVRKVVFTLCTSQAITEKVTTPDLSGAKLEKLILANADMYFPLDVQDYRLAWEIIGPKTSEAGLKELDVQLWALPNAVLAPYYTVANNCGLSVLAIDYCGHSMATAVGASFALPVKKEKKKAKLDLNAEISFGKKKVEPETEEEDFPRSANLHTDMHILLESDVMGVTCVQNNQVVFQRFIRCGSDPVYQLSELAMMVDYFRAMDAGRGSSMVGILSGSLTNDRALVEELRDMLSISLGLLDIPYDLRLTCCIGAARTKVDFGIPSLNRPSKAMQDMRTNLWQYALILVGGLLLIASVFSLLTARLTWSSNLSLMQSNVMLLQAESKKYDGYADNYESYIAAYNHYSQDWDTVFVNLKTNNNNLILVLDELEEILPEKATVTDMQIQATGMNVTFACETKEQAAYMIMALRDMEYADLLAVSSLSGGGSGPAKSYGTGKSGEKAPAEGGADISAADRQRLKDSLAADMDPFVVGYNLGLGNQTPDLLATLAQLYGVTPYNSYTSLEDVPADWQQRSDALYEMCMNNPFAMRAAEDMLAEHYNSGGELTQYVPQSSFKPSWTAHFNPGDLETDLKKTLNEFYNHDEYTMQELIEPLERVLKSFAQKDPNVERWYIYYLEGELNGTNPRPFIDLDKLADGLINEPDGYASVNAVLKDTSLKYRILSDNTLAILEEITAEPECDHALSYAQPVAPTCNTDGHSGYWYCSFCQGMWQDEAMTNATTADAVKLPAAHTDLKQVAAKDPTAKEEGWHGHWHCTGCGGYWMDAGLKTPTTWDKLVRPAQCTHTMTHTPAVAPTCDRGGNVEYWYCDSCQTYWLDEAGTKATTKAETVLAPKHGKVVEVPYKAPTDTENGHYAHWTCTDCGGYWLDAGLQQPTDAQSLIIAPNGCKHTLKHFDAIAPTCEKPGNVEYWLCEKCSMAWLDEAMTQPTLPAATVLPAAHQTVKVEAKEPTATEDGNVEHWYCASCQGYWLDEGLTQPTDKESVTLPAAGDACQHDVIKVTATEATCTEMGYNTDFWYCNICQHCWLDEALTQPVSYKDVQIPAAHKAVKVEAKEATATEDGNVEHWYCASCDSYWLDEALTQSATKEDVTLPATGSSMENEMLERLAQILTTYLETGETGLSEVEQFLVEAALEEYKPGMTLEEVLDEQLTFYFSYGETDFYPQLDNAIEAYLAKNPDKEEELREKYEQDVSIELTLRDYLEDGATESPDEMYILDYLKTGDSGEDDYNARLDKYISDGKVDDLLKNLLTKDPESLNKNLKAVMDNYRAGTGNTVLNARLEKVEKADQEPEVSIEKGLKEYLSTGTTNIDKKAIEDYLTTGKSGVTEYDERLNDYVEAGNVDGELSGLLVAAKAPQDARGTVMSNYRLNTGNSVINDRMNALETDLEAAIKEAVKYLKPYLQNGSADPRYDGVIKAYLTNGTFNNTKLDKVFADYIKSGDINGELTQLIYLYVYDNKVLQTEGYVASGITQMLNNYHKQNTTGSSALDNQVKLCYTTMLADYIAQLEKAKAESGKSSGGTWQPQDKRYFFTVVLAYNNELGNAELERKGLDPNEKILLIGEEGEE